jgi:hypothetical protein
MAKSGEGASVAFLDKRMAPGEAFNVHLVKNGTVPGHLGLCRMAPSEGGVYHAAFLHEMRAIARIEGLVHV